MIWNENLNREIPLGWETETLLNNSLCEIIPSDVVRFSGEKIYLATAHIGKNGVLNGDITDYENRVNRANMQPIKNSIWIAKMKNSVKRLFFTDESNSLNDYLISTGMFGFKTRNVSFEYMYSYLFSDLFESTKDLYSQGATQQAVNQSNLSLFPLLIPKDNLLNEFHIITKYLVKKIELLKEENIELENQRDFLLPLLMNGQVTII